MHSLTHRRAATALLSLGLLTACSAIPAPDPAPLGVFARNTHTGPRDLPAVPPLPASAIPGATFTLDGLWSGIAVTDSPEDLSCAYDDGDRQWTYHVTTPTTQQFSGVDNYPTENFYALSAVVSDEPLQEGGETWTAQIVVAFADSTGTYVQMYAPSSSSLVVRTAPDRSAVAFSMINTAEADRDKGSPTTAVGTITCP